MSLDLRFCDVEYQVLLSGTTSGQVAFVDTGVSLFRASNYENGQRRVVRPTTKTRLLYVHTKLKKKNNIYDVTAFIHFWGCGVLPEDSVALFWTNHLLSSCD